MIPVVQRNYFIDFCKLLGLALIILAHVGITDWLKEIRNFDVPLMVFISGVLSVNSFARSKSVWDYLKKRFFRLLLPTWIFLTIYFVFLLFFSQKFPPLNIVLKSFLLQNDSIGYVWIIRIYLMCAIIVPFAKKLCLFNKSWVFIGLVYLIYEVLYLLGIGVNCRIIESTLYYVIPYGVVLIFGMQYQNFSRKTCYVLCISSTLIFLSLELFFYAQNNCFVFVQNFKYPPRILYLSHAVMFISFLMLFMNKKFSITNKYVLLASNSTLWIYLWHIMALLLVKKFLPESTHYVLKYFIVILITLVIVFLQNKVVDYLERRKKYSFLKVFRG
ncbi:MAG: acyltransferase [Alphaproteobacteria bacterium]|nr:acyltransferase [Alphaproteobacteria bacterium]MBO7551609.1 acyltransferase [Fibrobacter sp.]